MQKKNGIPYFLHGNTCAAAWRYGALYKDCCGAYILMLPEYRAKFAAAMAKKMLPGRDLDSYESNPRYVDFSMNYCNTDTLCFHVKEEGFYRSYGQYVRIFLSGPGRKIAICALSKTGS